MKELLKLSLGLVGYVCLILGIVAWGKDQSNEAIVFLILATYSKVAQWDVMK